MHVHVFRFLLFLWTFYTGAIVYTKGAFEECSWQSKTEGNMTSPNYPDDYPPNTHCHVNILGRPEYNIEVTFHDFYLETGYTFGCAFDFVEIVDFRQKKYVRKCGKHAPFTLELSSKVQIIFKSDNATEMKGFSASWKLIDKNPEKQYSTFSENVFKRLLVTDINKDTEQQYTTSPRNDLNTLSTRIKDSRIQPTSAAFFQSFQGTQHGNRTVGNTGTTLIAVAFAFLIMFLFVIGSIVFHVRNRLTSAKQHAELLEKIEGLENCYKGYMQLDFNRSTSSEYNTIYMHVNDDNQPEVKYNNLALE